MSAEQLTGLQLDALRTALRSYGRRHFPALRAEVDDLIGQALSDLWEYLAARADGAQVDAPAVRRLAYAIFRRRAADVFRKGVQGRTLSLDSLPELEQAGSGGADRVKAMLYRQMLRICIDELAQLAEPDRLLLAEAIGLGGDGAPAPDARARQRLHRLRQKLAEAIRRELGEDAKRLLREDF
ncbi:MAG: hypothetical protein V4724_11470 [Pseudomonadota bacterium]